jgi:streptomycin 6-kinase
MNLPTAFVNNILQAFPEQGKQWLADLPSLLIDASRRWELSLGDAFLLSFNYVCAATRLDGTPAVLKLGVPNRELTSEIAALHLYAGEGACQLYEADAEAGWLLLERLQPGTMLHERGTDEKQTRIAAGVMKRLWRSAPEINDFITLEGWFDDLQHLRPRFGGGTGPFPEKLVQAVESLLPQLFASADQQVVLHGDCHHFNILDSQRGWLVIDPKGVIGPPGYEVGPYLMNPWDEPETVVRSAARRLSIFSEILGIDRSLLLNWAICHCLLSGWWDLSEDASGGEYSVACGEAFLKLKG